LKHGPCVLPSAVSATLQKRQCLKDSMCASSSVSI